MSQSSAEVIRGIYDAFAPGGKTLAVASETSSAVTVFSRAK